MVAGAAIELQVEEDSREGEKEKGIDVNTTLTVFESTPFIFLLIYLMVLIKLDHGGQHRSCSLTSFSWCPLGWTISNLVHRWTRGI